jgi:CRISPR-associated endonuclease/helicase Cas3
MYSNAWAKLTEGTALSVTDHGTDVAAVLHALMVGGWQRRFEDILNRPLTAAERDRFLALAFLHDMGKTNRGFWQRQFPGCRIVGHLRPLLAFDTAPGLAGSLGRAANILGDPDLAAALLAHHGSPVNACAAHDAAWWDARADYDPLAQLDRLIAIAAQRFPDGFATPPTELPPPAVALFAGLLTLADWIGSDPDRFPLDGLESGARRERSAIAATTAVQHMGLGADAALKDAARSADFKTAFGFTPHPAQTAAGGVNDSTLTILEAETGSGKTEAALWRFLRLFAAGKVEGVYFALPTRTSAVQMESRIGRFLDRVFGARTVPVTLALPGYIRSGGIEGRLIDRWTVLWPDDPGDTLRDARWASEAPKQFLAARIAVGTVDQALMAGLKSRHAHLRAACLSRSLLVVDEVHASDTYMTGLLAQVLDNHRAAGGHVMLLSATLGAAARTRLTGGHRQAPPRLAEAEALPYPALHGLGNAGSGQPSRQKTVDIDIRGTIDDPAALARSALDAASDGAHVIVLRNTVGGAIAVQQALEDLTQDASLLWHVAGRPALHHGRFAAEDRRLLDTGIESAFGKDRDRGGCVAVGTQTLEISLDLDADLMITDLAPMDVLLQRLGRLHRHGGRDRPPGYKRPRAVLSVPAKRDLTPFLGRVARRHGLGPSNREATGGVYANLPALEATWAELAARGSISLPRDNRVLVERATHPEALEAIVQAKGWQAFWSKREGGRIADTLQALRNALNLSLPMQELEEFATDERLATRLGGRDLLLPLPHGTPGAFGAPITTLRLPGWMAPDVPPDTVLAIAEDEDGCFTLSLTWPECKAPVTLHYDRLGLRLHERSP